MVSWSRPTSKPGKRLMYLALRRDAKLSRGRKVGVDFGCKMMWNRPLFETQEYYGVDLDRDALDKGLARFPEAKAIHARIEEVEVPPADFALCINSFGATNFGNTDPSDYVQNIIDCMAPGGVLLMTLKNKHKLYDLREHINTLRAAFREVDEFPIALDDSPNYLAWLKARYHFHMAPKVEDPKRYYCRCIGKR